MFPFGFCQMGELSSIICLENLWLVSEMGDCFFHEINGRIAALFHVRVDEPFAGGFVDHCILVELLWHASVVAGGGDKFHIHLPFHTQMCGRVIRFRLVGFLCGRSLLQAAQSAADPIEGGGMSCIAFGGEEFSVKFTDGNVGVPAEVIANPAEFLCGMRIGMCGMGSVGFVAEGFFCTVILLIPVHEGGFRDMIASADKGNADAGAVKFNGMVSGVKFMWQISL